MSTPPQHPGEPDDIDDFFSPEEVQIVDQEQSSVQTADSPAGDQPKATEESDGEGNASIPAADASGESVDMANTPIVDEQPTTLSEVPITLHVEIARLPVSLQKILDLKPGAVLSLEKDLEDAVDLVVEGKRIGGAELMRIGDTLGLRIVQLN